MKPAYIHSQLSTLQQFIDNNVNVFGCSAAECPELCGAYADWYEETKYKGDRYALALRWVCAMQRVPHQLDTSHTGAYMWLPIPPDRWLAQTEKSRIAPAKYYAPLYITHTMPINWLSLGPAYEALVIRIAELPVGYLEKLWQVSMKVYK